MPILNNDIPYFRAFCRRSYYTHNPEHDNIFDEVVAFGVQSVENRALTFHVMFSFGMQRARVPISALYWEKPDEDIPCHYRQLWDCFGQEFSITKFSYLDGKRCEVVLKDGSRVWGTYMFTVDWFNNSFSNTPYDAKSGHLIREDKYGGFLLMPNNRIFWKDCNWITDEFPVELKEIKVDKEWLRMETFSDKWVSGQGNEFYYEINQKPIL